MPTTAGLSHCPDSCTDESAHAHIMLGIQCQCGGYTSTWAVKFSLTEDATLTPLIALDGVDRAGTARLGATQLCPVCSQLLRGHRSNGLDIH